MGLLGWLKGGSRRREKEKAEATEPLPDPSRRGIEMVAAGRYAEACDEFRLAIAREPGVAPHYVNLAFALQESGDVVGAIDPLRRAAKLDPTSFDAHYMLGGALEHSGNLTGASGALQRAVELQPAMEQAHADWIRILAKNGRSEEASAKVEEALARFPASANLHVARGNLHVAAGETERALASFDQALALQPEDVNVRMNRAVALQSAQRLREAMHEYDLVLGIQPVSAEAIAGKAGLSHALGEHEAAIGFYRRALELRPNEAEWLNMLGTVLQERGETFAAIDCYRGAARLRPDLPGSYANLGLALAEIGDVPGAIVEYRKGLALKSVAEMHDNLAIALQKMGVIDEAIRHYGEALKLQPGNLNTRCNLAAALSDAGNPAGAIDEYRKILEIDDKHLSARSNLLFSLSVHHTATVAEYLAEARDYGAKVSPSPVPILAPRQIGPGEALRVGFVSGDLRSHPVGFFLEGILHSLDRRRFELFAYPTVVQEDDLTARIRRVFTGWRSLKGLTTEQAKAMIRDDRIDVLLDLAGHSGDNRLPVFAARAAPVQIAWLGFFASTGVEAMDYILADDVCVPPGAEAQFTEKVWRLPQTRLCFTPPDSSVAPTVARLPALTNGHITFGCLQRFPKINDAVLDLWGKIFQALPTARLYLQSHQTGRQIYIDQMLERLSAVGIARNRVTTSPPAPRDQYLRAYREVDIVLDTFPFNGGTTTCEALWMGVPTITLQGDTMIARQGMTMMTAAGLDQWVGRDAAEYVARAIAHASDVNTLASLRASLRERVIGTALFDVKLFAGRFSEALSSIWASETAKANA